MAEGADRESKTEQATEKKIRDTIEKGKLPSSREAPILASFLAILIFVTFFAGKGAAGLGEFLSVFLDKPEDWPLESASDAVNLSEMVIVAIAKAIGTLLALQLAAGITASALQNLPQFVGERIRPQFSRISPSAGWKRLFGLSGFVEFAKSVSKLFFVVLVLLVTFRGEHTKLLAGMITQPGDFSLAIRSMLIDVLLAIVLVMAAITAIDLFWSRFNWLLDLRMTKQEVKDEMKQAEGDPIIKSRLRSLARDRARRRMMAAVPRATLVIANPTHYSIALRYVREEDAAPIVVAKGQDLVALRIREIAEQHGIPVFEDVALARSMYKQVSVDSVIPSEFYQAVAELVRIVYANKTPRRVMR